jgi:hypothetical protein
MWPSDQVSTILSSFVRDKLLTLISLHSIRQAQALTLPSQALVRTKVYVSKTVETYFSHVVYLELYLVENDAIFTFR